MKFLRGLGIAIATATLAHVARAQPTENNVQSVRLSYAADSDCPSKEQFVQAIRDRGLSIRESSDATRAMSVTLVRNSETGQWNASMHVHDAHGDASREVTAASCDAAAHSIALFASLALTPETTDASASPPPVLPTRIPPPPRNPPKKPVIRATPIVPRVAPDLLHRDRFFIGPEANYFLSSKMFESFVGIGAVATYSFSRQTALALSVDWLHSFSDKSDDQTRPLPSSTPTRVTLPQPTSQVAILKAMVRLPFMVHVATGTLDGRSGSPFDFFITPSAGTIVTKPDGFPAQVSERYSPGVAGELDLGLREFFSQNFSLTAQIGFLIFEESAPHASYLFDARGSLRSTTYSRSFYGNFGPIFQLGAEFDYPRAPAAR